MPAFSPEDGLPTALSEGDMLAVKAKLNYIENRSKDPADCRKRWKKWDQKKSEAYRKAHNILRVNVWQRWKAKLHKSGKLDKFLKRCKEVACETGVLGPHGGVPQRLLFRIAKEEFDWNYQLELAEFHNELEDGGTLEQRRENAISNLPVSASIGEELAWIRTHPAMTRAVTRKENDDPVNITASDILLPPHGQCPSQAAARDLIYWVTCPDKFYHSLASEQRKNIDRGDEKVSEGYVEDVGLSDIAALLKEVRPNKKKHD